MSRIATLARGLRRRQTEAERRLWRVLRDRRFNGLKFRRQEPLGPHIADFVCIAEKLVIEIDGATHATPEAIERDEDRTLSLRRLGFRVLRFNNRDVYDDLDGVLATIAAYLGRHP